MPAFSVGMPRLREFDRGQAPKASRPRIVSKQRLKLQARSHHFNIRSSRLHDRTATRERKLERTSAPFYYFTGLGRRQGGRVGVPYLLFDPVPGHEHVSPLTHISFDRRPPIDRTATPAPRAPGPARAAALYDWPPDHMRIFILPPEVCPAPLADEIRHRAPTRACGVPAHLVF